MEFIGKVVNPALKFALSNLHPKLKSVFPLKYKLLEHLKFFEG